MKRLLSTPDARYLGLILVLALPALLINLDMVTFIEDEGIRGLVALEMKLSGDWITPTLYGEPYFKKPPLFNWIILVFYGILGFADEWGSRLPTVLALLAFGGTVYYYSRIHFNAYWSAVNALMTITCGRFLFWDSMLGLIDTTFSWLIFMQFMWLFHWNERGNHKQFFIGGYALLVATFLLKGLPALVFMGFSLLAYFIWRKKLRLLFSGWHFAGIGLFLALTGLYYWAYARANPIDQLAQVLWRESTMRTPVEYSFMDTVLHILQFPFEMTYHFLPWSLLVLYLFYNRSVYHIRQHSFISFCAIIFLANVWIYWISPGVFPRYLLMLFPLAFTIYLHLHIIHLEKKAWPRMAFYGILALAMTGFLGLILASPFIGAFHMVGYPYLKAWGLAIPVGALIYFFWKMKRRRLFIAGLFLLIFRVWFDLFILPSRNDEKSYDPFRQASYRIAENYGNEDLRLYKNTDLDFISGFYITSKAEKIIPRDYDPVEEDVIFIIDKPTFGIPEGFIVVDSFPKWEANYIMHLIRKEQTRE